MCGACHMPRRGRSATLAGRSAADTVCSARFAGGVTHRAARTAASASLRSGRGGVCCAVNGAWCTRRSNSWRDPTHDARVAPWRLHGSRITPQTAAAAETRQTACTRLRLAVGWVYDRRAVMATWRTLRPRLTPEAASFFRRIRDGRARYVWKGGQQVCIEQAHRSHG